MEHSGNEAHETEAEDCDEHHGVPVPTDEMQEDATREVGPPVPREVYHGAPSITSSITEMLTRGYLYPEAHALEEAEQQISTNEIGARPAENKQVMVSLQSIETRVLAKSYGCAAAKDTSKHEQHRQKNSSDLPANTAMELVQSTKETKSNGAEEREGPTFTEMMIQAVSRDAEPGAYAEAGGINRSEGIHQRAELLSEIPETSVNTDSPQIEEVDESSVESGLANASLVTAANNPDNLQVAQRVDGSDQNNTKIVLPRKLGGLVSLVLFLAMTAILVVILAPNKDPGMDTIVHPREALRLDMERQIAVALGDDIYERFEHPSSPYSKALNWLLLDDPLQLMPDLEDHPFRLLQRFILVLFWFQTSQINGQWKTCNPRNNVTDVCYFFHR